MWACPYLCVDVYISTYDYEVLFPISYLFVFCPLVDPIGMHILVKEILKEFKKNIMSSTEKIVSR